MSMRKKLVRLTVEELQKLKWLIGTVLSLLALWSLWSMDMQGEVHILVSGALVLLALSRPQLVGRIPSLLWKPIGFGVLLIVAIDFSLNLPEFMPPLLRMVVLLLLYRTLSPRRRRDDLQMVLLCLFCLVISGVLTVSLLFAFQILIFTPVAMGMLFLVCILDRGPDSRNTEIDWHDYSGFRLLRRVVNALDYRVLFLGGVMFSFVVVVSTLLFIFTPRFDLDQAIPYLQIKSETRAGFSGNVKLGEVSDIKSDSSVALRVDVPSLEAIAGVPYWRILTLDKYDRGYFRLSNELKQGALRANRRQVSELMGKDLVDDRISMDRKSSEKWTLYLEGGTSQYLPVPGLFHSIRFQGAQDIAIILGAHHVGLDETRQRVFSYQIEDLQWSHRFPAMQLEIDTFAAAPMELETSGLQYPMTTLELNMSDVDRSALTDLNAIILGDSRPRDAAGFSQLVSAYLWKNYSYSLSPDLRGEGEDDVVRWLQHARSGHCEYFAGAFILLAREAGYPARMVVGFSGGAWNTVEEYFVVRNDNAHAWVEIYDAQSAEWLRVDPTPGSGPSNPDATIPSAPKLEAGLSAWVDSLRIQWYRRIVNFDQGDQIDMAMTAKGLWDQLSESFSQKAKSLGQQLRGWLSQPFSAGGLVKIVMLTCGALLIWGVWYARFFFLELVYKLLRKPQALNPMRRAAGGYLRKLKAKQIDDSVCSELQAIRFGPAIKRMEAKLVIKRARKALQQRRAR